MFDSNWRVALDLLSVMALFVTAGTAWAAYRLQRKTTEAMQTEKFADRITQLEEAQNDVPTKHDLEKLGDRVSAVERHVGGLQSQISAVQASLDGFGTMLSSINGSIRLIQQHLLAQGRKNEE